jgi:bacterioferritin-associated ferredoxin
VIVCSCNVLSDCQIRSTIDAEAGGARTPGQVYRCLGCSPQCGRCARTIKAILDKALGQCDVGCAVCPAQAAVAMMEVDVPVGGGVLLGEGVLPDSVPHFSVPAE